MFVFRKLFYGVFITTFRMYLSKPAGLDQFSAYAGLTQRRAMKPLFVHNERVLVTKPIICTEETMCDNPYIFQDQY